MSAGSVADVELLWFRNSAMDAERTREHIARAESDAFFVCLSNPKSSLSSRLATKRVCGRGTFASWIRSCRTRRNFTRDLSLWYESSTPGA